MTSLTEKHLPDLSTLLDQLVPMLQPVVAHIEGQVPTTQNHYGAYMGAISRLCDKLGAKDKGAIIALGVALQRAGANKAGVHVKMMVRATYGSAETDGFLQAIKAYPEWMERG